MNSWFYENGIASIFALLWGLCLFTWVTYVVFTNPVVIPTSTLAAFTTMYGLPTIVIAFFKWRNKNGDNN